MYILVSSKDDVYMICQMVSLYPDDGGWDNRQEYLTLVLMTVKILFWDLDGGQIIFACIRIYVK